MANFIGLQLSAALAGVVLSSLTLAPVSAPADAKAIEQQSVQIETPISIPDPIQEVAPAVEEAPEQPEVQPVITPSTFTATVTDTGVTFSYSGPCLDPQAKLTIWSDLPGVWKSQGSGCLNTAAGQQTNFGVTMTWNEETRNAYCYSPLGPNSAYFAEVFGMTTEWVSIPEQFKTCPQDQQGANQ